MLIDVFFFEQSKFKFLQSAIVYNSFECYKAFICVHHDFPSKWSPLKKYKSYGPLQQDYSKSYHLKHLVPFSFCISSATLEYLVYVSKLPIKVLNSVSFELGPFVPCGSFYCSWPRKYLYWGPLWETHV